MRHIDSLSLFQVLLNVRCLLAQKSHVLGRRFEKHLQRLGGLFKRLGEFPLLLVFPGVLQRPEPAAQARHQAGQVVIKTNQILGKATEFGGVYTGFGHAQSVPRSRDSDEQNRPIGNTMAAFMQDADITQSIQEAIALYRAGRIDEAVAACRAVATSSRRPDVFAVLARMLAESGRVDDAIAALRESSTIQKSAQTLSNLGMLLLSRDRTDEATGALREALAIDPNLPDALNNLGVALRKIGDRLQKLIEVLQRATTLKPLSCCGAGRTQWQEPFN